VNPDGTPSFRAYQTPTANYAQGGVQIQQPLVNVQGWDQVGIKHRGEEAAKLTVEDRKRTLALSAANALVSVVTNERIAELNRSGFQQTLERLDLTQRKQRLGAATGLDVVRAQSDVEAARATIVSGDESLRQAREALGIALGIPSQVGVLKGVNINGIAQDAIRVCKPAGSIEERADIMAAKENLNIAKRNERNVDYAYLPTLNAQSTLGTTTLDTGISPNTTWNIQAILSLPIWDGGQRYGQKHQAEALADEALMSLEAARRQASVDLAQAKRGVQVAEAARKVAADAQKYAAETDRLTRASYVEGQVTSLDLIVSAAALRQADITLALREFDLVKARVLEVLTLATCPW
jgi:outer membrane protein TolC